jgi:hypothetical protein
LLPRQVARPNGNPQRAFFDRGSLDGDAELVDDVRAVAEAHFEEVAGLAMVIGLQWPNLLLQPLPQ